MDCQTTRNLLELVRPGSDDLRDPELAEASVHLDGCSDCQELFHRRLEFDAEISRVMQDVAVPDDLDVRLLSVLTPESGLRMTDGGQPHSGEDRLPRSLSRRRVLSLALASAACLLVGLSAWFFWPREPQFSIHELIAATAPADDDLALFAESLSPFDGGFLPELPGFGWRNNPRLRIGEPRGKSLEASPHHAAAIYFFDGPVRGMLVAVPKSRIDAPPDAAAFQSGDVDYHGRFAVVRWSEGNFVYVCYVQGGDGGVQRLARALDVVTA